MPLFFKDLYVGRGTLNSTTVDPSADMVPMWDGDDSDHHKKITVYELGKSINASSSLFQSKELLGQRNAIPIANRRPGMVVYVEEDNTFYTLLGPGVTNSDWVKWRDENGEFHVGNSLVEIANIPAPLKKEGEVWFSKLEQAFYQFDSSLLLVPLNTRKQINEIWVAPRTDGIDGKGTPLDPLDWSGSKMDDWLDAFYTATPDAGLTVHFAPGVYYIKYHYWFDNPGTDIQNRVWRVGDNWHWYGAGIGRTIIRPDPTVLAKTRTNTITTGNRHVLLMTDRGGPGVGDSKVNSFSLHGITFDGTETTVPSSDTLLYRGMRQPLLINGSYLSVTNCEFCNFSKWDEAEAFFITLRMNLPKPGLEGDDTRSGAYRSNIIFENNIVRDMLWGIGFDRQMATAVMFQGGEELYFASDVDMSTTLDGWNVSCRNNRIQDAGFIGLVSIANVLIDNNYIDRWSPNSRNGADQGVHGKFLVCDTGYISNVRFTNNTCLNGWVGPATPGQATQGGLTIGNGAGCRNFVIKDNYIHMASSPWAVKLQGGCREFVIKDNIFKIDSPSSVKSDDGVYIFSLMEDDTTVALATLPPNDRHTIIVKNNKILDTNSVSYHPGHGRELDKLENYPKPRGTLSSNSFETDATNISASDGASVCPGAIVRRGMQLSAYPGAYDRAKQLHLAAIRDAGGAISERMRMAINTFLRENGQMNAKINGLFVFPWNLAAASARNLVAGGSAVGTFGGSMQHISKLISPFGTGYLDTDVALEDNPMIGIYCPGNSVSMTTGETMIGVRDGSGNEMSLNVDATGISGIYNGGTQHWTVGDTSMRGAYCLNVTPSGSDKELKIWRCLDVSPYGNAGYLPYIATDVSDSQVITPAGTVPTGNVYGMALNDNGSAAQNAGGQNFGAVFIGRHCTDAQVKYLMERICALMEELRDPMEYGERITTRTTLTAGTVTLPIYDIKNTSRVEWRVITDVNAGDYTIVPSRTNRNVVITSSDGTDASTLELDIFI